MIYHLSLSVVSLLCGLMLAAGHGWALFRGQEAKAALKAFPRHTPVGYVLMGAAVFWVVLLCALMDMGEFSPVRRQITVGFAVLGGLVLWLLTDYLAVRGLGALLLLAANVLLDAAFLHDEPWKLVVVCLAYAWIVAGIVCVTSPYLLRDGISWAISNERRFRFLAGAGAGFGVGLMILGLWLF
jgi:hypothetical protein